MNRSATEGRKVLVSAPYGQDAASVTRLLGTHGYNAVACASLAILAAHIDGQAGAILVTEEALAADLAPLLHALGAQPAWSDVPLILLAGRQLGRGRATEAIRRRLPETATNVILLERPVSTESLVSTIAAA
ncbi:MAG TPA: hypothetical protein VE200_02175, partial [Xanthobacteraceae bacterium]|nr:hypothetical protein [Xanthobacteraceae bacterium]